MRYGINTWVWTSPLTNEEFKDIASKVAKIGYDWIEIPLEGLDDIDYAQAATVIRENGLGISCTGALGPDRDLISPDPAIRENAKAYVRGAIDAAQQLGATNLVGPFYSAVGRTWQQTEAERQSDLELVVASLKELGAYAADHGVVICLEPLNRFETSFMNLASQIAELVDRVDSPGVAMMLDTFHMHIEERNSGDAIRLAGKRLKHIHTCESDRGAPGTGQVHWDVVAQAIKDIGYNGPLVIESFTPKVKSIARAAAIWRPLADSPEALAENGYQFLKKITA
jgi:D-psicose/D-tagatose/L-ribulose 3-epimerase